MTKANQDIRKRIESNGIFYWQVAEGLNMTDGNFSRLLRKELPAERKERVLNVIDSLITEKDR